MAKKRFPKLIFVTLEPNDNDSGYYFLASEDEVAAIETSSEAEPLNVGVYKLLETRRRRSVYKKATGK